MTRFLISAVLSIALLPLICFAAEVVDKPMDAANPAAVSSNRFAFDLYQRLAHEHDGKNLFLSPYSISSALAMTVEGARGATAEQMGEVLRYTGIPRADDLQRPWILQSIHRGFAQLNERFNTPEDDQATRASREELAKLRQELSVVNEHGGKLQEQRKWKEADEAGQQSRELADRINKLATTLDRYELRIANALWGEQTYPFQKAYLDTVAQHYGTGGVHSVDFIHEFPAARDRINTWVADQTRQRIKDIIPQLPPDEAALVRLILTNAIYFKGEWSEPFEAERTKDADFRLANGQSVTVPLMEAPSLGVARYAAFNADGSLFNTPNRVRPNRVSMRQRQTESPSHYPKADGFTLVQLPYKGGDLSMVVIAPQSPDGLPTVEKLITPQSLEGWLAAAVQRDTHVVIPRFKIETKYLLADTLKAMGMKNAFTDPRLADGADFSGMSASADPEDQLYISQVIHKAFVEVNEKGTEAAAATAVMMLRTTSAVIDVPFVPTFKADRPFLYLIRDNATGTILFLGRMHNPASQ